MTQEEKQLLLQDLSARLPYGVMIQIPELFYPQRKVTEKLVSINDLWHFNDNGTYIENVRPYLRPMSSMTEEEKIDYRAFFNYDGVEYPEEYIDWLNAHHFDYRGLIEKGLAIAVTEENNPYKS